MINVKEFPKRETTTYTVIPKHQVWALRIALEQSGEQGWQIRTCTVRDKSMLDDIKEHLPDWFDARYCVLVSNFDPEYVKGHMDAICADTDIKNAYAKTTAEMEADYKQHHKWKERNR